MSGAARIGLDNPAFSGRLRDFSRPARPAREAPISRPRVIADYKVSSRRRPPEPRKHVYLVPDEPINTAPVETVVPEPTPPLTIIKPEPFVQPGRPRQQRSGVLKRQFVHLPGSSSVAPAFRPRRYTKLQLSLVGMACLVFVTGLLVSWQTLQTNHLAAAQISTLSKKVDKQTASTNKNSSLPSTTKPSAQSISQYIVAPDLPRYLKIPKLGVDARVMQVGTTSSGALGTPSNVYDTAWYTGSAKPGQPGATLIDGHVSSWTAHGVFYNIKSLAAGDAIQIERGDGTILNYQVVKTEVYNSDNVDMQAAITPITAGKSGLNLITCTGQVEKGTSEFNERVIVFAQQV